LFSDLEVQYLKSQPLARIATASPEGLPEVSPVGFQYIDGQIYVGSHDQNIFFMTKRYHNVRSGNTHVSIVIDDLVSRDPWTVRGIKITGDAEIVSHVGIFGPGKYLKITPVTSRSWGIDPSEGPFGAKKTH
jgi:pyridoxamine 5'-phosphate oxidase family protein